MARNFSGTVQLNVKDLTTSIADHDRAIKRLIASEFIYAEPEAVSYAKQNAPWTDDTGNARAGLFAKASPINGGEAFELVLAHTVPYGIWLEVRFSGRYAIIMPTLNVIGSLLIQRIAERVGAYQ